MNILIENVNFVDSLSQDEFWEMTAFDADIKIMVNELSVEFNQTALLFFIEMLFGASVDAVYFGKKGNFSPIDSECGGSVEPKDDKHVTIFFNDKFTNVDKYMLISSIIQALLKISDIFNSHGYGNSAVNKIMKSILGALGASK